MAAGGRHEGKVIQATEYRGCSAARLHTAAGHAVSEIGFVITARDDAAMTLAFRPATPTGSWPYEQMTAVIQEEGSGARIVLAGEAVGGARTQMGQWREGHAIAAMVLDRLKSVLPLVPEPTGTVPADASRMAPADAARMAPVDASRMVPAGPSRTDQLSMLADLRDRGLPTDAEFAAEKQRLLDG